jgi:hypothetical protein
MIIIMLLKVVKYMSQVHREQEAERARQMRQEQGAEYLYPLFDA